MVPFRGEFGAGYTSGMRNRLNFLSTRTDDIGLYRIDADGDLRELRPFVET